MRRNFPDIVCVAMSLNDFTHTMAIFKRSIHATMREDIPKRTIELQDLLVKESQTPYISKLHSTMVSPEFSVQRHVALVNALETTYVNPWLHKIVTDVFRILRDHHLSIRVDISAQGLDSSSDIDNMFKTPTAALVCTPSISDLSTKTLMALESWLEKDMIAVVKSKAGSFAAPIVAKTTHQREMGVEAEIRVPDYNAIIAIMKDTVIDGIQALVGFLKDREVLVNGWIHDLYILINSVNKDCDPECLKDLIQVYDKLDLIQIHAKRNLCDPLSLVDVFDSISGLESTAHIIQREFFAITIDSVWRDLEVMLLRWKVWVCDRILGILRTACAEFEQHLLEPSSLFPLSLKPISQESASKPISQEPSSPESAANLIVGAATANNERYLTSNANLSIQHQQRVSALYTKVTQFFEKRGLFSDDMDLLVRAMRLMTERLT